MDSLSGPNESSDQYSSLHQTFTGSEIESDDNGHECCENNGTNVSADIFNENCHSDIEHQLPFCTYDKLKNEQGLKCFHLNVCSLYRNFEELKKIILDIDLSCISINETRLCSSITDSEVEIPGYTVFRKDRSRNAGGVAVYIKNDLSPSHIEINSPTECMYVKLSCDHRNIVFGSVYRPPSANAEYYEHIFHDIDYVFSLNMELIIAGDFNFDLLSQYTSVSSKV